MQVEDAGMGSVIRTARSVGGGADSFSTFAVQGPSHMVASDGEGAVRDADAPRFRLHRLKGDRPGQQSDSVSAGCFRIVSSPFVVAVSLRSGFSGMMQGFLRCGGCRFVFISGGRFRCRSVLRVVPRGFRSSLFHLPAAGVWPGGHVQRVCLRPRRRRHRRRRHR